MRKESSMEYDIQTVQSPISSLQRGRR